MRTTVTPSSAACRRCSTSRSTSGCCVRQRRSLGGFGAVRARRGPLPMCRVEVDPCYSAREDEIGCINPEFYEVPAERPSFRVFAQVRR